MAERALADELADRLIKDAIQSIRAEAARRQLDDSTLSWGDAVTKSANARPDLAKLASGRGGREVQKAVAVLEEIEREAQSRITKAAGRLTHRAAVAQVLNADPDLFRRWRAAVPSATP